MHQAIEGFLKILRYQPSNSDVLEQLRVIFLELDQVPRALTLYQEAFEFCKQTLPDGPENGGADFGMFQLIALADIYNNTGEYESAIKTIRQGARWLAGRLADSAMWDGLQDDREYDLPEHTRSDGDRSKHYPLDINLRERLAVSRLRLGHLEEAGVSQFVHPQDPALIYSRFTLR